MLYSLSLIWFLVAIVASGLLWVIHIVHDVGVGCTLTGCYGHMGAVGVH